MWDWLPPIPIHPLLILDALSRLVLAVRVIMSRRSVPSATAWLTVLLLPVPLVPIFAYGLFGENRLGGRRLRRYRELTKTFSQRAQVFLSALAQEWDDDVRAYRAMAHVLTQVGDIPPLKGNMIEFVAGSEAFVKGLIRDIDGATERVHLLFYIWMGPAPRGWRGTVRAWLRTGDGSAGLALVDAIERAAKRGVTCRVIVDAVGSTDFVRAGLVDRLRTAGVQVSVALPVNPVRALFARLDLRNHRKVAVIDGRVAWSGSSNVTDDSFGWKPVRRVGPWVDAMARLRGPAAQALDAVFLRDWLTENPDEGEEQMLKLLHMVEPIEGGCPVQVVPTGPDCGPATMRDALVTAIFSARRELIMTTPYFVPDEATKEALVAAAMRGVAVTVVVPKHLDHLTAGAAGRSHLAELMAAGVRVMLHRRGLLHSKTITIDTDVAMIGSHNVDQRSFTLNFEVSLFIYDVDQASLLRMLQVQYISESDEVDPIRWARRPLWKRFAENCARLMGPLL